MKRERVIRTDDTALVVAAQAGDRRALDELVSASLPMVYSLVGRAMNGEPDVEDVVQDVMLRALRQLGQLRAPESFRSWLAAIAVRQAGTHLQLTRRSGQRTTPAAEPLEEAEPDPGFEDETLLRVELSAQRRQVQRASRWLDPDDRVLLSLWWLEVAGELTRADLSAALGESAAHVGVRVQRMRAQLEVSRSLTAALDSGPACARLRAAASEWDGVPSPLWRKRLTRHVRTCAVCAGASAELIAPDRLLPGMAWLPVPATLGAAVLAKSAGTTAAVKAGIVVPLAQWAAAHPIAATVAAGVLAAGATVTTTQLTQAPPPAISAADPAATGTGATTAGPPAAVPSGSGTPTGAPSALRPGPVSLEAANVPGRYAAVSGTVAVLAATGPGGDAAARRSATFEATTGRADPACLSFRIPDGRYLRHLTWRVQLSLDNGTELFRGDSTFCVRPGATDGSVTLESANYPGWFLRHRDGELWVDQSDGSATFRADSSFIVRAPLAE